MHNGSNSPGIREQRTGLQEAEEKNILCAPPADGAQVHLPANHPHSSQMSSNKPTNSHRWSSPGESLSPVLSEWFWRGWVVPSAAHTILQFHQWSPQSLQWWCHQREPHMIRSACVKTRAHTSGSLFSFSLGDGHSAAWTVTAFLLSAAPWQLQMCSICTVA